MRPLLFILLITGIWFSIIIILIIIENKDDFISVNKEVFDYIFKGKT